jgi:hypothetical protein
MKWIVNAMERYEVEKGRKVRFVGPRGVAPLTTGRGQHLLTDCIGQIVMGPSEDIWCYPDYPDMDMVWVAFVDDIKPFRQVSAAWLEAVN